MTSGSLWNCQRDQLNDDANENNAAHNKINYIKAITSKSFEYKTNLVARTPNNNNLLDAEVVVPLKYFSNFGRYVDLSLISCEKELDLNLSLDLMFFFQETTYQKKRWSVFNKINDKKNKGTHWVSSFIDRNLAVYFDSFGIEYIPLEVLNKIKDKSITHNIFRIQDNESTMCRFYCIAFIKYMLSEKTLFNYTNLFSPVDYKKNHKTIYKYFKDKCGKRGKSQIQFKKN